MQLILTRPFDGLQLTMFLENQGNHKVKCHELLSKENILTGNKMIEESNMDHLAL